MTLPTYDPNIRWAVHTVEITYQAWDYTTTAQVTVKGNCRGMDILKSAVDNHADRLFKEQGDYPTLVLTRPGKPDADGTCELDTLETSPEDESLEDWLEAMCLGVRIVAHVEDKPLLGFGSPAASPI